jgi:hypothetical protein
MADILDRGCGRGPLLLENAVIRACSDYSAGPCPQSALSSCFSKHPLAAETANMGQFQGRDFMEAGEVLLIYGLIALSSLKLKY